MKPQQLKQLIREEVIKIAKSVTKHNLNEILYYVGYNKGRGLGRGIFKDSYSSYKDAKKAVEKIEKDRGGSSNMTAYYVADKDGRLVAESINEANINWKEFYTMAKDTSGHNPNFEKKYGNLMDRPHIADALKKARDFNSFLKAVKQFEVKESVNEGISVSDERHFGKKGIIIMIDDNGKKVSAIFKDKKNADKYNRNNPSDIKKLLDLAKKTKYPNAIDESVESINEGKYDADLDKIEAAVKNASSFIGAALVKKSGMVKDLDSLEKEPIYVRDVLPIYRKEGSSYVVKSLMTGNALKVPAANLIVKMKDQFEPDKWAKFMAKMTRY